MRIKTINIVVTNEDIQLAESNLKTKTRCPIAAAIMNEIPTARHIIVTKDTISYLDVDQQTRFKFKTPPTAISFIKRWDAGEKVNPIGFSLAENSLISWRPPKQVSTKTRVKRDPHPVIQQPGSRMIRNPDEQTCDPS
jgi:hypothetical protein